MNVVLCDQQKLFSDAFATVLTGRGWNVVSMAADPAHAVAVVSSEHVDACITELTFADGNAGIAGIVALRDVSLDTKVVVLTASSDPKLIVTAVEAGADAIVFKDDDIDFIVDVINRAVQGGFTDSPRCPTMPSTRARDADPLGRFLTAREYEVLQHLVDGHSGKQLARDMNMAYSTARTHIQNILMKLGVHSRLEAVAFATANGLCQQTVQPAAVVTRSHPVVAA